MDQIKIGRFIAERRKSVNLTQAQLAERLDLSPKTISKWETAKGLPDISLLGAIASALDIVVHLGRLRDRSRRVLEISEVTGMENEEVTTRQLYKFVETGTENDTVVGELRKINDLMNVNKLMNAGLIEIYRERYV